MKKRYLLTIGDIFTEVGNKTLSFGKPWMGLAWICVDGIGVDLCEGVVCVLNQWLGLQWTHGCGHEVKVNISTQYVS